MSLKVSMDAKQEAIPNERAYTQLDNVRTEATHVIPLRGYNHAIAVIMTNAAYRTSTKVTFNEDTQGSGH